MQDETVGFVLNHITPNNGFILDILNSIITFALFMILMGIIIIIFICHCVDEIEKDKKEFGSLISASIKHKEGIEERNVPDFINVKKPKKKKEVKDDDDIKDTNPHKARLKVLTKEIKDFQKELNRIKNKKERKEINIEIRWKLFEFNQIVKKLKKNER